MLRITLTVRIIYLNMNQQLFILGYDEKVYTVGVEFLVSNREQEDSCFFIPPTHTPSVPLPGLPSQMAMVDHGYKQHVQRWHGES